MVQHHESPCRRPHHRTTRSILPVRFIPGAESAGTQSVQEEIYHHHERDINSLHRQISPEGGWRRLLPVSVATMARPGPASKQR